MSKIETLVQDIYGLLGSDKEVSKKDISSLADSLAVHITNALKKRDLSRGLRASNLGTACDRKSWYNSNSPELAEDVEPWVKLKFLFGHIHEELVLFLAEQAGHNVSFRQQNINIEDVEGHTDGVIDGVVIDVKSANSRGMDKFRKHKLEEDDPFGYMAQIDFYYTGFGAIEKEVAFIACDKEMGHIVLDRYKRTADDIDRLLKLIEHKKKVVALPEPPPRGFAPELDGKSGNMKLGLTCKYCEFKNTCYPLLRTFLYSDGPRFLTHVVKEPDVKEI